MRRREKHTDKRSGKVEMKIDNLTIADYYRNRKIRKGQTGEKHGYK